jgi:transposase
MIDLQQSRVLEVVEGRDSAQAMAVWAALPPEQRGLVEAAAMDMGANFVAATRKAAPRAAIVNERFHVAKHLDEALDGTRPEESARLAARWDQSLRKIRYLWLQGTIPDRHQASFGELLEMILKTSLASLYQKQMIEFSGQLDAASGARFFRQCYRTDMRSRLPKVIAAAGTLKAHLAHLLTYFQHPITNALIKGFNSKIQAIKADARGFRRSAN